MGLLISNETKVVDSIIVVWEPYNGIQSGSDAAESPATKGDPRGRKSNLIGD